MITICCTGGRNYAHDATVYDALEKMLAEDPDLEVGVGDSTGLDALVRMWCRVRLPADSWRVYRADWARYGRAAGPLRNEHMLRSEQPSLLLAFPGGPGTANCCMWARRLHVRIEQIA